MKKLKRMVKEYVHKMKYIEVMVSQGTDPLLQQWKNVAKVKQMQVDMN